MTKVICPYCGKETDQGVCPRCSAEIPRETEEPVKAEPAPVKKGRKNNKEV